MDPVSAIVVDGQQMLAVVSAVLWTSLRTGGLLMAAPLLGTRAVPNRVKVMLAMSLSLAVSAVAGPPPVVVGLDPATVLLVAREIVIGVAMGFMLRLAFEAGALAGELIAQGTGLSFATLADPMRGVNAGVVGTWFYLAFTLLFLAMDGHLGLVELLAGSYRAVPLQGEWTDGMGITASVPAFFALAMRFGVQLALPVMLALLVVNLAFGVLSRASPALNPIQLGLPASLLIGLVLLAALMGELLPMAELVFRQAFEAAASVAG